MISPQEREKLYKYVGQPIATLLSLVSDITVNAPPDDELVLALEAVERHYEDQRKFMAEMQFEAAAQWDGDQCPSCGKDYGPDHFRDASCPSKRFGGS